MMKYVVCMIVCMTFMYGGDCTDRAYNLGVGMSKSDLSSERSDDLDYFSTGRGCTCDAAIIAIVEATTMTITPIRVNPATDTLIESLENQLRASDIKIRELVNLKYINSMYSFYDQSDGGGSTLSSSVDGCGDAFNFPSTAGADEEYRKGILLEIISMLHYWKKGSDNLVELNKKHLIIKE